MRVHLEPSTIQWKHRYEEIHCRSDHCLLSMICFKSMNWRRAFCDRSSVIARSNGHWTTVVSFCRFSFAITQHPEGTRLKRIQNQLRSLIVRLDTMQTFYESYVGVKMTTVCRKPGFEIPGQRRLRGRGRHGRTTEGVIFRRSGPGFLKINAETITVFFSLSLTILNLITHCP